MAGLLLGGIIFGAVHVAAWDFVFPTLLERNLWRAASIACTAVPLFAVLIIIHLVLMPRDDEGTGISVYQAFLMILFTLLWVLYFAARLLLLVEIFRTLCFLPPSAYVATWAANVPHVA
jgi:hypothetical protein